MGEDYAKGVRGKYVKNVTKKVFRFGSRSKTSYICNTGHTGMKIDSIIGFHAGAVTIADARAAYLCSSAAFCSTSGGSVLLVLSMTLIPALEWLFICDLTRRGEREGGMSEEGPHPLRSN
jgi:hypothetical protein